MVINTNVASLNAWRNLENQSNTQSASMAKLSSGKRINKAADDAAGLAISEKMISQINGLDQASSNAQDGISLVQTAEGALNETTSIIQRLRQLAVQSRNGTETDNDRVHIQKEVGQLLSEVNQIASTTQFNTMNLLNGSTTSVTFQIGANQGQTMAVSMPTVKASDLSIDTISLATAAGASAAIKSLDAALSTVSGARANLGAVQNRLQHAINNLQVASENLNSANSRVRDVDMAKEMASFSKTQVLVQAGTAMLAQANQMPQSVLKLLG
ncbi:flagellin [Sporomusaceae bacterium BoRhaA]|uniref:flagellin N-terminal helical domain-containing protein n=1 Tax=Pelorhabdus rhamnosifermentans TaxID=2772457 RepID=UPI001C0611DB|nr:flagellin [Pelorhabdus rhamnosifermentans]MBU2699150.1 flagellin [Pelorhabdus rhamnosifermentans]